MHKTKLSEHNTRTRKTQNHFAISGGWSQHSY